MTITSIVFLFFLYGYIPESQYLGIFFPTIDEDSEYIEEAREVEIEQTNKAARQVQQCIMQELRTVIGDAQMLPENTAKDLILQVSTSFLHLKQTV